MRISPCMTNHVTQHSYLDLIELFNASFKDSHNTVLISGAEEPLYQPCAEGGVIYFREDFFSSALHEIAHWCIAGEERRRQVDYGYWYITDGRNENQQADFFSAEVKPQALEWLFSIACNYSFSVSVDNVNAATSNLDWNTWERLEEDKNRFKSACFKQASDWLACSIPTRADRFITALLAYYRPGYELSVADLK